MTSGLFWTVTNQFFSYMHKYWNVQDANITKDELQIDDYIGVLRFVKY